MKYASSHAREHCREEMGGRGTSGSAATTVGSPIMAGSSSQVPPTDVVGPFARAVASANTFMPRAWATLRHFEADAAETTTSKVLRSEPG